jgi:hypothetical protein
MIFTRSGVRLYGLMEFATPRTFSNSGKTNASALIDIDLDQNPATGFTSVYDYLLRNIPELDSHLGAELLVGIEPREDFGDSAYVGVLTSDSTSFVVADLFGVGVCGTYFGFNTDSIIGAFGDDGNFDFTVLAIASSGPGAYADAAPESGFFQATLDGTSTSLLPGLAERLSHYLRKAVQGVVGDQRPFRRR